MTLEELIRLLDRSPVIADLPPVSVCYLPDDVIVTESLISVIEQVDCQETMLPSRILISSQCVDPRFPKATVVHDPVTPALNAILCRRFSQVADRMLCQSQIGDEIVKSAPELDLIILLLIDGLSYENVREWKGDLKPCLVDVPTVTHLAFPNLVGTPTIAQRLFDFGYDSAIGFSYWTRKDNSLTDQLFRTIPVVHKAGDFVSILNELHQGLPDSKTFVQIVRSGLDGYAHHQKRKPPVSAIVSEIKREWEQMLQFCQQSGRRAGLFLSSDHGILWRDQFEPQIVGSGAATQNARYSIWRNAAQHSGDEHVFVVNGEHYHCLSIPNLRRGLRIDEQGVHGGISYQESITPFLHAKVFSQCSI